MRFSTALKVLLLVVLGLLTSWATSSIVAQTKSARTTSGSQQTGARQAPAAPAQIPIVSTVVQPVRDAGANMQAANDRNPQEVFDEFLRSSVLAETTLLQMEATATGRQVVVSEAVHIMDKSPKASYVWALRVYRGQSEEPGQPVKTLPERLLSEHYYVDQTFQVPGDEMQMKPTFREVLELEPGVYYVEVSLHRIRPTFDVVKLTNDSVKQSMRRASDIKRVVIAD